MDFHPAAPALSLKLLDEQSRGYQTCPTLPIISRILTGFCGPQWEPHKAHCGVLTSPQMESPHPCGLGTTVQNDWATTYLSKHATLFKNTKQQEDTLILTDHRQRQDLGYSLFCLQSFLGIACLSTCQCQHHLWYSVKSLENGGSAEWLLKS